MDQRPKRALWWAIPLAIVMLLVVLLFTPIGRWLGVGVGRLWQGFLELPGIAWVREQSQAATPQDGSQEETAGSAVLEVLQQGRQLQEEGAYEKALERYREALALDDTSAPAHVAAASVYLQLGRDDEALQELERAAELVPDDAFVQRQLGRLYLQREEWDASVAALERARQADPQDPLAPYFLGIARYYRSFADAEGAVEALETSTELAPEDADAHFYLAIVYNRRDDKGDSDKAIAALRRALALDPQRMEAYYYLGQLHMKTGQREAAVEAWRKYVADGEDEEKVQQVREWLKGLEGE